MIEELVSIENGEIEVRGNQIFYDLYLQVYKSEIMGIVFDNIVERKCLLSFLNGQRQLNGGKIFIDGKRCDYDSALMFFKDNTTVIEKNSKLIDKLTIEENIFLFTDSNNFISKKKYKNNLQLLFKKFNLDINVNNDVKKLTAKERIIIELLKAYYEDKKLLVLNYISGQLLNKDYEDIHTFLLKLTKHGMSFIMIETFNSVVFEWVDRFYLIGNGKTTKIIDSNSYNNRQLYSYLVNRSGPFTGVLNNKTQEMSDVPILEFENVYTDYIKNLNFSIRPGEVFKIVYVDDDSCEHIVDLLKGNIKPVIGEIRLQGRKITLNSMSKAFKKGICFIEESPYENMLFYNMTLDENICLALSKKVPFFWFRKKYRKSLIHLLKTFNLDEYLHVKLMKLDPRTLQVIAYLKWYLYAPNIVICIRPFTELDINLQEITLEMIHHLKSRGITVIILSKLLSETHKVEGHKIYIKDGRLIDKDDVYITLYRR